MLSVPVVSDSLSSYGLQPPGSSAHGILQPRILEWVALPFSRGSSWPRDRTCVSCIGRQIPYRWATWEGLCAASGGTIFANMNLGTTLLVHLWPSCQEPGCVTSGWSGPARWWECIQTALISVHVRSFVLLSFIVWNAWCLPRIDFDLWNVSSKMPCLIFTHLGFFFFKDVITFIEV